MMKLLVRIFIVKYILIMYFMNFFITLILFSKSILFYILLHVM